MDKIIFGKMAKKIFIIMGHPDVESLSGALANAYEEGAKTAGCEVRRVNLGELHFDPILHKGYKVIQELEPDLVLIQENMKWADHLVLVYPSWWGATPALLKGMFDRMFLPGFAFRFEKGKVLWEKLLKGKSARVIITMDNHPVLAWLLFGDTSNEVCRATLGFAGFAPVRLSQIGPLRLMNDAKRETLKKRICRLGEKGI